MIISTASFRLNLHRWGDLSNTSKRLPLLLLHGFLGSGLDWLSIAKQLQSKYSSDVCVVAPDIPGHGDTTLQESTTENPDAAYTIENVATTILECLDHLNVGKCLLCGYSMGGRLALYLTLNFPERFSETLILSATAGLRSEQECAARREHDIKLAQRLDTEPFIDFLTWWYNQPLFSSFRNHVRFAEILQNRTDTAPKEAARSLRGMGTGFQPNLWNALSSNEVPITFAAGEYDTKFVALAQELYATTPHSRLLLIPDAGHVLHVEAENSVLAELRRMLATAAF